LILVDYALVLVCVINKSIIPPSLSLLVVLPFRCRHHHHVRNASYWSHPMGHLVPLRVWSLPHRAGHGGWVENPSPWIHRFRGWRPARRSEYHIARWYAHPNATQGSNGCTVGHPWETFVPDAAADGSRLLPLESLAHGNALTKKA
jgi:hypothetical protein